MFKKVESNQSFPKMEEEVLKFWEENGIFEKSVEKSVPSPLTPLPGGEGDKRKDYVFYDGPPFATGTPHYGHIVGSVMKDVVPRFWTMKGYRVERKWGWDCHGLPIENIVEKEMGSKTKKEIEELGVEKFNELCRSKVLEYVSEWEKVITRLGRWADMKNAYKTMDLDYMESIWWVFKELYDKGLVYESYRSMHICPRCETTLSQMEVSEGYKNVKDLSAVVKFKLKYKLGKTGRGVGALIVNKDNKILLVRRNEKGRKITWALPGGKVEKGENFIDALKREVNEELGVEVELAKAFLRKPDILEGMVFETLCYETKIKGEPRLMIPDELDKLGWFSLDNLPEIDYPPSRDAIEIFQKKINEEINEEINMPLPEVYVLAWTTTPWTLIGNVALAVNKDIDYVIAELENKYFVFAESRLNEVMKDKTFKLLNKIKGDHLVGLFYEPLFDYYSKQEDLKNKENGWKVYAGDFVTTDEGTGVVHIAPAFGDDDFKLSQKYDLPFVQHVGMDGIIKKEAGDPVSEHGTGFAGINLSPRAKNKPEEIREADLTVVKFLEKQGKIFHSEKYEHSYPHCWRCDTPLLNYATSSWFVAVTKVKEKALELAKEINWTPKNIKEGRFGNWLSGARDWSISRQRFWASVMPIWKCEKCKELKVLGSVKELEDLSGEKVFDLHKHVVDKITFKCEKCDGTMKRIPDVLDTWFDSGSMPYAQMHYPFENKEKFEANFPAQFIAEGIDQTRAWFYYLHVLGTALKEKPAFKNVIANGIVLAEDGKKMSKRLKNYPDPMYMFEKYGADATRFYLMSSSVVAAENLNFKESDVADIVRGMMRMLWNSYSFFVLYANIDGWKPSQTVETRLIASLLDRWIISELNVLIKEVDESMEKYELNRACKLFPKFIDNLSNWYIRRSRKRFWKSEDDADKNEAYQTLHYVLVELSKLMAPFTPFVAEEIYRNLMGNVDGVETRLIASLQQQSVHLADFPVADEKLIDEKLNKEMESVRNIITQALQLRANAGIKVRQPLGELKIKNKILSEDLIDIIKDEVNVKKVVSDEKMSENVLLNTEITKELKLEGQAREIIRFIQELRKEAGFEVDNRIVVGHDGMDEIFSDEKLRTLIAKEVLAVEMKSGKPEEFDIEKPFDIAGKKGMIWLKKE